MADILLLEMGLACVVAAALGYFLDKLKGVGILGAFTLVANALTWLVVAILPMARLDSPARPEVIIVEIAIWTYVLAGFLGYFLGKMMGIVSVEIFAVVSALVCTCSTVLLGSVHEWLGVLSLLAAMLLIGTIGVMLFSKVVLRDRGGLALRVLWFGFCVTCLIGFWVAGRLGTFFITLPTLLFFGGFLFCLSQFMLPLRDGSQRMPAFRSLLTFALGTNYPFYVIEDWRNKENCEQEKPEPRVPGNIFRQFMSGPGIILCSCDHLAVTSTGFRFRTIPPGLSFTWKFEDLYAVVDLRPQLRVRTIKAETKDGIVVNILAFMPHRIGTGGRQPRLGRSYPYDEKEVLKAVFHEGVVEHTWERDAEGQAAEDISKTPWDELVLTMGTPILKKIISGYTCNELHMPGDPRVAIAREFRKQLREAMAPLGIEMIGGGISDIKPPPPVVEQRIKNWEAEWKRRIEIEIGETQAEITRQLESVWIQTQLQMMNTLTRILERGADAGTMDALAFQLIDALTEGVADAADEQAILERLLLQRRSALPGPL